MQICPCEEDPLTPYFYIVKLGFTGVGYTLFSYFRSKTRLWVLVRTATIYVLIKNKKISCFVHLKIIINLSIMHVHICVMPSLTGTAGHRFVSTCAVIYNIVYLNYHNALK